VPVLPNEKGVARFERVMLVLSGGGALGPYQAGVYAAMEAAGFDPDWIAATGVGAVNAALVAGNPPRQRVPRLRSFWHRLAGLAATRPGFWARLIRRPAREGTNFAELRALLIELVDFARVNAGTTRLTLLARHEATGSDVAFDNDRYIIGPEHVLAAAGLCPARVDGDSYCTSDVMAPAPVQLLSDGVAPADTLCFVVDCFDPDPGKQRGGSRSRREIAAIRRRHDLRRSLGLLAEKLPAQIKAEPEIAACLAQGSLATMNLVHLVHECRPSGVEDRARDYSAGHGNQRWRAGERDMAASLSRPVWLAPPPRRLGVVVHEVRGRGA
jgi:NTE family protein